MAYQTPNWIGPQAAATWGNQYAQGVRAGLSRAQLIQQAIRQAQANRQHQAELEQRARQFEAQQAAREEAALRKEQELAVEQAYKESVIGLRERELEARARIEARRLTETAARNAAHLKIAQQNADTARMRVAPRSYGPAYEETVGGQKVLRVPGSPTLRFPPSRSGTTASGENALRSGLASAQAVLADSNASDEQRAAARMRADRITQQLGEEFVTEPIPGTGSPAVPGRGVFNILQRPEKAVPPTMTNYFRKIAQPPPSAPPSIPTAPISSLRNPPAGGFESMPGTREIAEPTVEPSGNGSSEVIRLTKEGRRAVFDADTKEFLRYAD